MKKNSVSYISSFLSSAVALCAVALISSCSDIDTNDRYVQMPYFEPASRVLIEDFTGQKCVNCPAAHEEIAQLHELYGDAVVAVAIHGGSPGFEIKTNNTRYIGLADDEGAYYGGKLSDTSRPLLMINRDGNELSPNSGTWQENLRAALSKPSECKITVEASLSTDLSTINTSTSVTSHQELRDLRLQLWVVEDSIVAYQLGPDGQEFPEYVHNHVFRGAVNGLDGERITLKPDVAETKEHSIERVDGAREKWNPAHLFIVGFVSNDERVLDVVRAKVN